MAACTAAAAAAVRSSNARKAAKAGSSRMKVVSEQDEVVATFRVIFTKCKGDSFNRLSRALKRVPESTAGVHYNLCKPSKEDLAFMCKVADTDGDGDVSDQEACFAFRVWLCWQKMFPQISAMFDKLDEDGSGSLDAEEVLPYLVNLNDGEEVLPEEAASVISRADASGDGSLDKHELAFATAIWYADTSCKKAQKGTNSALSDKLNKEAEACLRKSQAMDKLLHTRSVEILPWQNAVEDLYNHDVIQVSVACLIVVNFVVSAVEAQIRPPEGTLGQVPFKIFEWFFGVVFLAELIINMYGTWCWRFWESAWNVFDFGIVLISVSSLLFSDMPGISVLRLFRAFRVFRLFKRIKSLRLVIEAACYSLPAVSNVFIILGIIMAIWAIVGVDFFGKPEEQTTYDRAYFGTFSKAMLTLFQVWTGDAWCSDIARPVVLAEGAIAGVFFITFTFANGMIMTNTIVAVLCDGFMSVVNASREEDALAEESVSSGSSSSMATTSSWDSEPDDRIADLDDFVAPNDELVKRGSVCVNSTPDLRLQMPVADVYTHVEQNVRLELAKVHAELAYVRRLAATAVGNYPRSAQLMPEPLYVVPDVDKACESDERYNTTLDSDDFVHDRSASTEDPVADVKVKSPSSLKFSGSLADWSPRQMVPPSASSTILLPKEASPRLFAVARETPSLPRPPCRPTTPTKVGQTMRRIEGQAMRPPPPRPPPPPPDGPPVPLERHRLDTEEWC